MQKSSIYVGQYTRSANQITFAAKLIIKMFYLISHNNATPRKVQCLGLNSVSKSIEPTYF